MNWDNYKVHILQNQLQKIDIDGETVELKNLVGTPIWDKVNNIISMANLLKYWGKSGYSGVIDDEKYKMFINYCKSIIDSQLKWVMP